MAVSLCTLMYTFMHVLACLDKSTCKGILIVGVYAGCQQMHQGTAASIQGQTTLSLSVVFVHSLSCLDAFLDILHTQQQSK